MTQPEGLTFEQQRRVGIGGSDAAAVIGLHPFRTALELYRDKIGEAPAQAPSPAMLRGKYLEDVAVDLYCAITGRKVRRQPQRAHDEFPYIIGNIDRQILAEEADERGTGLLEVKCPSIRVFLRYKREGLPAHIVCQGQHYLGVYGYDWMEYVLFNADLWQVLHFPIARDDVFIEGLFEAERRFWREHVEKRVPPPETGVLHRALPAIELPPTDDAIVTRDDAEWRDAAEALAQARQLKEDAEGVEELARARVKELMGEHRVVEGASLRAYHTLQPGKKTFDRKALEAARPLDWQKVMGAFATCGDAISGKALTRLTDALADCRVDFAEYEKTGKPFPMFRPFFLKPDDGGEDE